MHFIKGCQIVLNLVFYVLILFVTPIAVAISSYPFCDKAILDNYHKAIISVCAFK